MRCEDAEGRSMGETVGAASGDGAPIAIASVASDTASSSSPPERPAPLGSAPVAVMAATDAARAACANSGACNRVMNGSRIVALPLPSAKRLISAFDLGSCRPNWLHGKARMRSPETTAGGGRGTFVQSSAGGGTARGTAAADEGPAFEIRGHRTIDRVFRDAQILAALDRRAQRSST